MEGKICNGCRPPEEESVAMKIIKQQKKQFNLAVIVLSAIIAALMGIIIYSNVSFNNHFNASDCSQVGDVLVETQI